MSTRIIIEKDGERYAPVDLFEHWFADDMSSMGMSNDDGEIEFAIKPLPPVERSDDSAVIARLKAENAELNRTIDDNLRVAKACRDSDQDEKFELRQERSRLICENAKLREALKPILEVNSDFRIYKAILCHETDKLFFLQEAVQKAKDIMNKKDE